MASITSLPRYPLSVVLSYLGECDGTSALITNQSLSRRVLPHFALRRPLVAAGGTSTGSGDASPCGDGSQAGNSNRRIPQTRHSYRVYPVQDADTLLSRLNSRRLAQRVARIRRELLQGGKGGDKPISTVGKAYKLDLDTNGLAWLEWQMHQDSSASEQEEWQRKWPAELELLMWRDGYCAKPSSLTALPPRDMQIHAPFPVGVGGTSRQTAANDVIVLASYPRSGNTLLRSLMERTTLCVTGSDTRPDRTLSRALAEQHNLVGEGVVRPRSLHPILDRANVGCVKTHWPERKGCLPYATRRVILLVRNPFDSIDSYWNLCVTNTHTESVVDSVYERYADKFRALAISEMKTWVRFHSFWLDQCRERGLDICVVRYEDLVTNVEGTFRDVMKFVLDVEKGKDLNTFWEGRVRHVLGLDQNFKDQQKQACTSNLGSYRPRCANYDSNAVQSATLREVPPSVGKSLLRKKRYSGETLRDMHEAADSTSGEGTGGATGSTTQRASLLKLFGYDIFEQGFPNNVISDGLSADQIYRGVHIERHSNTKGDGGESMRVNVGAEIRPYDDPYGRAMTTWRKGETSNDVQPFPTVSRLNN